MKRKIAIGNDHCGVQLKHEISKFLFDKGYTVTNYGTDISLIPYYQIGSKQTGPRTYFKL